MPPAPKLRNLFFSALLVHGLTAGACAGPAPTSTIPATAPAAWSAPPRPTSPATEPQAQLPNIPPIETRLVWFYKPPVETSLEELSRHFDLFILTQGDEAERDRLQTLGVTSPILQYLRFDAIHAPATCAEEPRRNQVAYLPNDFCLISAEHPDWFLLDAQGQRLTTGEHNYYFMDPGNPGWRAFWLERAQRSQTASGWSGVFLDNVELSLSQHELRQHLPGAYPDEASYRTAVLGFLEYIYTGYFQPHGRPVYANLIGAQTTAAWAAYLPYLDGAMCESWAVGWNAEYRPPEEWEAHLTLAEQLQQQGKQILLVAQGPQSDTARQRFALASYLLVNQGQAAFRYAHSEAYREVWLYADYTYPLGQPVGPRYQASGLWRRDFTHGYVTVDPLNHTATIESR